MTKMAKKRIVLFLTVAAFLLAGCSSGAPAKDGGNQAEQRDDQVTQEEEAAVTDESSGTDDKAETGETAVTDEKAEAAETAQTEEAQTEESAAKGSLLYMGHASIRITTPENKVIYIDPFAGEGYEKAADLILVTHGHYDHYDLDKISERNPDCRVITWQEALSNGEYQTFDCGFASVEAVEAGNNQYHNITECVGYIVTLTDGVSVYVSGDTSTTDQMSSLAEKKIDYAFFCCDGVYNMDLEEAAQCAAMVKAAHNIPYHMVRADSGTLFDSSRAEQFDVPDLLIIEAGQEITLEGKKAGRS